MTSAPAWLSQLLCAWLWIAFSVAPSAQSRSVGDMIAALSSDDAATRARAACELKAEGDLAADAIPPLVRVMADASPVERAVCGQHWWRNSDLLTTPGEQAAQALVSIGSRAFEPVLAALHQPHWVARRNAAWALGVLGDSRATAGLIVALKDADATVRRQAAWALGVIGK